MKIYINTLKIVMDLQKYNLEKLLFRALGRGQQPMVGSLFDVLVWPRASLESKTRGR